MIAAFGLGGFLRVRTARSAINVGTGKNMRDYDIRQELRQRLRKEHEGDPETLVIEELGLCQGQVRADIAVINGFMHGYEIKSERDTLERLPRQREVYEQCFDAVTLV